MTIADLKKIAGPNSPYGASNVPALKQYIVDQYIANLKTQLGVKEPAVPPGSSVKQGVSLLDSTTPQAASAAG
jgi:hypothetical protein